MSVPPLAFLSFLLQIGEEKPMLGSTWMLTRNVRFSSWANGLFGQMVLGLEGTGLLEESYQPR